MKASPFFVPIAIVLLLWNLMGVAAFIMQFTMDYAELAKTDPYTARMMTTMPGWLWGVYAVAVGAGTLGAGTLLARRAAAAALFALSLVAVIIQFGHALALTDLIAVKGWSAAAFPAFIVLMAAIQYGYARALVAKGALR
ncbi:sugar transporter [Sphingobium fontiphilum]|nr:sugar transporter [Sphingobium fontiphilum]